MESLSLVPRWKFLNYASKRLDTPQNMVQKRRFFRVEPIVAPQLKELENDIPTLPKSDSKDASSDVRESDQLFVIDDDSDDQNYEDEGVVQEISPAPQPNRQNSRVPGTNGVNMAASNGSSESQAEASQNIPAELPNEPEASLSQIGQDLFHSQITTIIGDVPDLVVKYLHTKYFNQPNYLQLASNEYFNGIDVAKLERESKSGEEQTEEEREEARRSAEFDLIMNRMRKQSQIEVAEKQSRFWKRYIGTLDVVAWATRPFMGKLQYKEELEVKRLIPNKIKKLSFVASKFGDSSIIRLYTKAQNREIGRIPEDITRILAPLIDLDLAIFEATVVMETTKRLSTGDTFYIQIRCYLNNNTFADPTQLTESSSQDENSLKKRKLAKSGLSSFSTETEGETALRLKQKSILRLFEKLHLVPGNKPVEPSLNVLDDDTPPTTPAPEQQSATDELDLEQIKDFYTTNQLSDIYENLPDTTSPPASNFTMQLRQYQKQGLSWMLSREKESDLLEELSTPADEICPTQKRAAIRRLDDDVMNPLWSIFCWPTDPNNEPSANTADYFYANLYNGEFSTEKPLVKNFLKGGILADEMGLGKTILTLALIHSVPYELGSLTEGYRRFADKSTLIVVPMSLLSQWKNEFNRSNNNSNHSCYVYYGDLVQADLVSLLCNRKNNIPIVVLTTYGTVQNEWARINKLRDENGRLPLIGLFSVEFFRVVLDEGHTIRNRTTKTAKAIHELELRRRWVLSGTPVINRLDDIFSLVKFLRLEPWSNFSYWKTFVTLPFEQKKFNQTLDVVKSILQPIFLRRTKSMKQADGTPLVSLPEKEVVIEDVELSKRERFLYELYKSRAYNSFKEGLNSGELLRNYTQILTHILRLRQICCHSELVSTSSEMEETWGEELTEFNKTFEKEKFLLETYMKQVMFGLYNKVDIPGSECSICTQAPIAIGDLTITECGHQYCYHCLMEHIQFQTNTNNTDPLCPDCRHPISQYRLFKVRGVATSKKEVRFHTKEDIDDPQNLYPFQIYHHNPDESSAKIQALLRHLRELKENNPGQQAVVFSQFSTYLDIIENELRLCGLDDFIVYKFDGRLNLVEREKVLKLFTTGEKVGNKLVILLLSLKAGGVGLNLTCANRAFMMDPWWSPSVEDQAIDRVHRIGQNLNVKVVRFIVANSIENKMLRIQERKRMMGEAVEVEEEERRKQRIEEIKLLFDE